MPDFCRVSVLLALKHSNFDISRRYFDTYAVKCYVYCEVLMDVKAYNCVLLQDVAYAKAPNRGLNWALLLFQGQRLFIFPSCQSACSPTLLIPKEDIWNTIGDRRVD